MTNNAASSANGKSNQLNLEDVLPEKPHLIRQEDSSQWEFTKHSEKEHLFRRSGGMHCIHRCELELPLHGNAVVTRSTHNYLISVDE